VCAACRDRLGSAADLEPARRPWINGHEIVDDDRSPVVRTDLFATEVALLTMPTKTTSQPTPSPAVTAGSTKTTGIRTLGVAMVLTILGELVLGMANTFWLQLPDSGSGWKAGAASALLMMHMTLGITLLVLAIWIAVAAFRGRDRNWLTASAVGALGILLAIGGGFAFMSQTSNDGASFLMAVGTSLAIAAYAVGLYRLPATSNP
jgi:hypothetical protein